MKRRRKTKKKTAPPTRPTQDQLAQLVERFRPPRPGERFPPTALE